MAEQPDQQEAESNDGANALEEPPASGVACAVAVFVVAVGANTEVIQVGGLTPGPVLQVLEVLHLLLRAHPRLVIIHGIYLSWMKEKDTELGGSDIARFYEGPLAGHYAYEELDWAMTTRTITRMNAVSK